MVTEKQFLDCYQQGFSDSKIGAIYNVDRHIISRMRNDLELPRFDSIKKHAVDIRILQESGLNDSEIANKLNIGEKRVRYTRKMCNIPAAHIERVYKSKTDRRKGYIIRNIKYSATRYNRDFDLDYTDMELPKYCPILNIELSYTKNSSSYDHASVDRIDNNKGYVKGNVVVISRLANSMKNEASFEQLKMFSENILKLTNYYENRGALDSITNVFPNIELYEEI